MKTISDFTIYCTESQIKRAIELGAKMEYAKVIDTIYGNSIRIPEETGEFYQNPTAEQMIGFILESGRGYSTDLSELIREQGYKQGCLTFIDSCLK